MSDSESKYFPILVYSVNTLNWKKTNFNFVEKAIFITNSERNNRTVGSAIAFEVKILSVHKNSFLKLLNICLK